MNELYNKKENWVPFLTRPFTLFGASLWYHYYTCDYMREAVGAVLPQGLFIEHSLNLTRAYREEEELEAYKDAFKKLVQDKTRLMACLLHGREMNKKAEELLAHPKDIDLEAALNFLIELTVFATSIPYFSYMAVIDSGIKDKDIIEIEEELRSVSLLFKVTDYIVMPLIHTRLHSLGCKSSHGDLITYDELLAGNVSALPERIKARSEGKLFIYQNIENKETVAFVSDVQKVISEIEGQIDATGIRASEIKGVVAYKGKVQGRVKIVLSWDGKDADFDTGDILVAPSTSPNLIYLMEKAAAFITNEGGSMSHAAIISREMKKPCIVGTKIATKVLKDGDMVEVDAEKGIVKILK
jgi:pyruvate, water dikinase